MGASDEGFSELLCLRRCVFHRLPLACQDSHGFPMALERGIQDPRDGRDRFERGPVSLPGATHDDVAAVGDVDSDQEEPTLIMIMMTMMTMMIAIMIISIMIRIMMMRLIMMMPDLISNENHKEDPILLVRAKSRKVLGSFRAGARSAKCM